MDKDWKGMNSEKEYDIYRYIYRLQYSIDFLNNLVESLNLSCWAWGSTDMRSLWRALTALSIGCASCKPPPASFFISMADWKRQTLEARINAHRFHILSTSIERKMRNDTVSLVFTRPAVFFSRLDMPLLPSWRILAIGFGLVSPKEAHNDFRREHGSCALQWSDECYQAAKKQANACQAKRCMFHATWIYLALGMCETFKEWGNLRDFCCLVALLFIVWCGFVCVCVCGWASSKDVKLVSSCTRGLELICLPSPTKLWQISEWVVWSTTCTWINILIVIVILLGSVFVWLPSFL